jgi:hypothetical protein
VRIRSIHAASSRLVCEEAVGRDDETVAPWSSCQRGGGGTWDVECDGGLATVAPRSGGAGSGGVLGGGNTWKPPPAGRKTMCARAHNSRRPSIIKNNWKPNWYHLPLQPGHKTNPFVTVKQKPKIKKKKKKWSNKVAVCPLTRCRCRYNSICLCSCRRHFYPPENLKWERKNSTKDWSNKKLEGVKTISFDAILVQLLSTKETLFCP